MSSGFQSSEHQSFGLSDNGSHVLHFEFQPNHSKPSQTGAGKTESHDAPLRLRFNNMTLDELSEELDRRTKEMQRLQEEVENATKEALERFGCTFVLNNSSGQSCQSQRFNVYEPPVDFTILSTHQQALIKPQICGQDSLKQAVDQTNIGSPGKEVLDNVVDACLKQLSDVHLNETPDQPEQGTFSFDKAIMNLQTKLHKVQMEKDAQSDLRLKDSRKHVYQMEKMLCMLEELQNIKRAADQKLQETEDEALALNKKIETLERVIREMYSSMSSHEILYGEDTMTSPENTTGSPRAATLTDDLINEGDKLEENVSLSVEHQESEECSGIIERQRMEELIASLGQEMTLLTDVLSSSKTNSVSLSVKLEQLKKVAERQTSLHQYQVSELESTLSSHKDKICCLEQQLIQAQSQLMDAQTERERSLQQTEELRCQLGQLKRCGEQQRCELQVEVNALRGRLEVTREQLRRVVEEKICLQDLLERRVQEERESQELLQKKGEELQLRQQENQQCLFGLEEAQRRCQTLHAEGETLKLKLEDREKMINILRSQTESSVRMIEQHSHTIENLHQENSLLSNQLNQHKLEIQHFRADLDKHKSDLAAAEHEKRQLQASIAEQSRRVQEDSLEKQRLITQLEVQCMQLLTLTKEHKELQRLHSCKTDEQEGVVLELQSQLRDTCDELDQVRTTLRTLEGADGHGLQVAMDMQKEITARREQVDTLQGKIQYLEEAMEKLYKEKRYQNLENQRQLQELTFIREEKRQLANELEALQSKDQQLRDRICELEAILHKMSESFADCQDFIQLQEQEFFRLKLQHTLDLKELQGKHLYRPLNEPPPVQESMTLSGVTSPPSLQHSSNTQFKSKRQLQNPAQELRFVVKELQGVISENRRPHTDNHTADFHRRRSAPERVHSTAFTDKIKEVNVDSRLRRKTCGSDPHLLTTAELNGKIINNKTFTETPTMRYTSSTQLFSLGRRSPVHCLLTSDPNS
ncbi:coiled-coil domain-containing protein 158 isoform X2 [Anabas testudineus]|uniref:coiled-coil domain-containing protein 158 isoform X2 n=1 Tax=Anabas testudineus TaxID=64144 RepID=UPI000E45C78E|nr:coiled-coil domain-containing protein 158 isoform X2 [Anabas testudineus]